MDHCHCQIEIIVIILGDKICKYYGYKVNKSKSFYNVMNYKYVYLECVFLHCMESLFKWQLDIINNDHMNIKAN